MSDSKPVQSSQDSFIHSFYTAYIGRDFFAKVIPGAIVLFSITILPYDDVWIRIELLSKISVWLWLVLYGICFSIGFVVQSIGEYIKWVQMRVKDETEEQSKKRHTDFIFSDMKPEVKYQRERFVILKEMAGNVSLALFLSLIGFIVLRILFVLQKNNQNIDICWIAYGFFVSVGSWFLFLFHKKCLKDQYDLDMRVLEKKKE